MQTVPANFTSEEEDVTRSIAHSLQVSWHRDYVPNNRTFTIGVSTIGGNDAIGANPGALGSPANYKYFDESNYVTSLAWERGLNMPVGGLTKALGEAHLDNTSGRFTPRYMGGRSELYTAILPQRPMVINAGFNYGGIDNTIPQFVGLGTKQPRVDSRSRTVTIQGSDYIDFFENKYLDQSVMFTAQRTDQVMAILLGQMGMTTAQYDLDYGINNIPFGYFPSGTKMSNIFHQLAEAENGHFYQDEIGVFKFKNRQWGDSSPYNTVQKIITTAQVINAEAPSDDHIINVVEVRSEVRNKKPEETIYRLNATDAISLAPSSDTEVFIEFQDPVLSLTTPTANSLTSYYVANSRSDATGDDYTGMVSVSKTYTFGKSARFTFSNSGTNFAFITQLVITGRPAKVDRQLYVRNKDGSSLTAYNEQPYQIQNDFIQNESWANSLSNLILSDFSSPESIQKIVIRAMPDLQLFDLISWQGRYWRIFNIRTSLDPSSGFVQELTLLQRTIQTYFRIGISTIGGGDRIAP